MKKMYKYLLGTITFLSLIMACNKEISDDLVVFYTVEFNETTIESFLNTAEATDFKIVVQGAIETGDYQIKYDVTQGSGYYMIDPERISEGQFIDLPAGPEFSISYVSTTAGVNNVTLTLRDKKGREKDFAVIYNVSDIAFTFDVLPEPSFTYIAGVSNLNFDITEISSASYDMSYAFGDDNTGAGAITVEGEDVAQGDKKTIVEVGSFAWQFTGTTIGVVDIIFTIESSLGVILEETISVEVTETPDFLFSAVLTNDKTIAVGNEAGINFNIEETFPSTYTMKYTTTNAGSLSYGGQVYQVGDDIEVSTGSSVGVYTGTISGEHTLVFTVSNANLEPIVLTENIAITYREISGIPPTVTLNGESNMTINFGEPFVDPGVTITDDVDTDLTVTIEGEVNVNAIGEYTLVYNVTDSSNNTASVSRTISVVDTVIPVITITGESSITLVVGDTYVDQGATAIDNVDDNAEITSRITVEGADVDTNTTGVNTITYSVSDIAGNAAVKKIRTVTVVLSSGFDPSTGILRGFSGASIQITMNSRGEGSGSANINVKNQNGTVLGEGFTCWGTGGDFECFDPDGDGDGAVETNIITFVMPIDEVVNITGSHTQAGLGIFTDNSTVYIIKVQGAEMGGGIMTSDPGGGIPSS